MQGMWGATAGRKLLQPVLEPEPIWQELRNPDSDPSTGFYVQDNQTTKTYNDFFDKND